MPKARIFNIMQYENHPDTKEPLLSEETIRTALLGHRMIKRWAYIKHDKDVYSASDEEGNPNHKQGEYKPPHWHIVIELGTKQIETYAIANWFKVAENFVSIKKGYGAFLDCTEYLTHEHQNQQELGKVLYADEEVKANFDFRQALIKRAEQKAKYGREMNDKQEVGYRILREGYTLHQCAEEYPLLYQENLYSFRNFRLQYLNEFASFPTTRLNIYIEGTGGIGKGIISKLLAKQLAQGFGVKGKSDSEYYFTVGSGKTTFEGYDGQKVIIWDDCRASTLFDKLGSRENIFNVFDPHPQEVKQNIKYSSVRLINEVNIINSVESYKDFITNLAGNEPRNQVLRRIPLFIIVHEEDYAYLINKGVFNGTREFDQFLCYNNLVGNFQSIRSKCGDNEILFDELGTKALNPVINSCNQLTEKITPKQTMTDDEIKEIFKNVGSIKGKEREVSFSDDIGKQLTFFGEVDNFEEEYDYYASFREAWGSPNITNEEIDEIYRLTEEIAEIERRSFLGDEE